MSRSTKLGDGSQGPFYVAHLKLHVALDPLLGHHGDASPSFAIDLVTVRCRVVHTTAGTLRLMHLRMCEHKDSGMTDADAPLSTTIG